MGAMEEIRHWGAEALELDRPPERINPKTEVLPTFASGPYGGAHRALVLAAKDHVRAAAAQIMG